MGLRKVCNTDSIHVVIWTNSTSKEHSTGRKENVVTEYINRGRMRRSNNKGNRNVKHIHKSGAAASEQCHPL